MYTAEEYRNLMIGIMKMAIHNAWFEISQYRNQS